MRAHRARAESSLPAEGKTEAQETTVPPWAGLFALGLRSPHLSNGGSSCRPVLQAGWARTFPRAGGEGWRAGGEHREGATPDCEEGDWIREEPGYRS